MKRTAILREGKGLAALFNLNSKVENSAGEKLSGEKPVLCIWLGSCSKHRDRVNLGMQGFAWLTLLHHSSS